MDLICDTCKKGYTKPSFYKTSLEENHNRVINNFYSSHLTYCDSCRRKRESEALKSLSDILNLKLPAHLRFGLSSALTQLQAQEKGQKLYGFLGLNLKKNIQVV